MNNNIVYLLSHSFGSSSSEFSSIAQYLYASFVVNDAYLKGIFRNVAIEEMDHLNSLGKLICKYGKRPIYGEYLYQYISYWNGNNVYYDTDLKSIFSICIEMEKKAIYDYHMILSLVGDDYVKVVIENILKSEYRHLKLWQDLRKKYCLEVS